MSSQTACRAKASRLTTTRLFQGILAVSEVMPKVVAMLLGYVEGFVFFFPSCACALDKFDDVVGGDRADDKGVAVGNGAVGVRG